MKRYSLKTLVEVLEVTPSFIRRLEDAGLISPAVEGDEALYTERDVRKLFLAKDLREMGINFAGIEIIVDMSERMMEMRKETDEILHKLLRYIDENVKDRKYGGEKTHE